MFLTQEPNKKSKKRKKGETEREISWMRTTTINSRASNWLP